LRRSWIVFGLAGALVIVGALVYRPSASASNPRVPASDDEVLQRVPSSKGDPREMRRAELRASLARNPKDVRAATSLARLDVEASRARSDPRYLGYAQAALAPWWDLPDAPTDVLVLRATIRQSQHDFEGSLADLDRVVAHDPGSAQTWITRAVVLTVLGRYDEARKSCDPLDQLAPRLVVTVCRSGIDAVTGQAQPAQGRLKAAVAEAGLSLAPEVRAWAVSTLGEIATRLGRDAEAEQLFQNALAIDADDPYVIAALADLWLDEGRPKEAAKLVESRIDNDGLLLRLVLAEKAAGLPSERTHEDMLASRYDASRLRGDTVHQREQARFELGVRGDAKAALPLATANWKVQHEPWDVRILLECALAAGDAEAARPATLHVEQSHLEDPHIAALVTQIHARLR
jgi:Flp pilus assembly protein TadD